VFKNQSKAYCNVTSRRLRSCYDFGLNASSILPGLRHEGSGNSTPLHVADKQGLAIRVFAA
jgi:hypothetical protein